MFCSNGIAKENDFSANRVYFGGLCGAERIVRAYIHGGWLMKSHRTYVACLKSKNPNGIHVASNLYELLCKASLWTCNRAKVVARAVPLHRYIVSEVFDRTT